MANPNSHPVHPNAPITVPQHSFFASPTGRPSTHGQQPQLPLHLVALILSYIDNAADLARLTRTSRLFYYMALPKLYEEVTLRSYPEIRYVNGRPEGYGNGSPFAMGLNTLVSRTMAEYVQMFRLVGSWREHDLEDYSRGRVPDNSMMLSIALRAALDKMKNLKAFAWELGTKPMQTVYQGIISRPNLTVLTLRQPTKRIPRPTVLIPPLPNLKTLIVYDMDPLCYPDDISLLLLTSRKLENLTLHWNPRMREMGEESVNLMNYFGRCLAAKHKIPAKRIAFYNLYARNTGEGFDECVDPKTAEEMTFMNSLGSSDPMTVFLDHTWRVSPTKVVPYHLKMMRGDMLDKEHTDMLARFTGLERLYLLRQKPISKPSSTAATPTTSASTATLTNPSTTSIMGGRPDENHHKTLASDYLAVIQSNHRSMRHLLLSDTWILNADTIHNLCVALPNLEQLGFACGVPTLEFLRKTLKNVPRLWAVRVLVRPDTELAERMAMAGSEMHQFALASELWRPEYKQLKYFGIGDDLVFKLGGVVGGMGSSPASPRGVKRRSLVPEGNGNGVGRHVNGVNGAGTPHDGAREFEIPALTPDDGPNSVKAKLRGPLRAMKIVSRESVSHIAIWGMDSTDFDPTYMLKFS